MANTLTHQNLIKIHNKKLENYITVEDTDIYHYTSPTALNSIISNHAIRFTDRNYLNDYSEGRYVMELCVNSRFELRLPKECRAYFKERCRVLLNNPMNKKRHIYQCSFSTQSDNLSLWNYYTKSDGVKGYNIGFNSKELSQELITSSSIKKHRIEVLHGKVVYSVNKQKSIIKSVIDDFYAIINDNLMDFAFMRLAIEVLVEKILLVGSFFKSLHFKQENEYRLLIHLTPYFDEQEKVVKFMVLNKSAQTYEKNNLLIPYLDIEFAKTNLNSICISPTLNYDETISNLKNALNIHGYSSTKVQVVKSEIPIRY